MEFGIIVLGEISVAANESWGVVYLIVYIGLFLPGIAVAARRLHDVDRSGWWQLVPIVNIVFLAKRGSPRTNSYGPPA